VGRKPFGRLAIANADADAYAYTDCATDQGLPRGGGIEELVRRLKALWRGEAFIANEAIVQTVVNTADDDCEL
jgi:hypothetical protein